MASELEVEMPAPPFRLPCSAGGEVSLEDLHGTPVVLFFYPKDDTPGCTREACAFRDLLPKFEEMNARVFGVSRDDLESHQAFIDKFELTFPLLSDTSGQVTQAYGVWQEKTLYGKTSMGIVRSTFVIDGDGIIRKIWRRVNVDGHAEEVGEVVAGL